MWTRFIINITLTVPSQFSFFVDGTFNGGASKGWLWITLSAERNNLQLMGIYSGLSHRFPGKLGQKFSKSKRTRIPHHCFKTLCIHQYNLHIATIRYTSRRHSMYVLGLTNEFRHSPNCIEFAIKLLILDELTSYKQK